MVKHIVMFKLRGTEEERKKVAKAFAKAINELPEKIEVLRGIECCVNANPSESWDVVLTALFETMEDVAIYSSHPDHQAAASLLSSHKEDRGCVDYYV